MCDGSSRDGLGVDDPGIRVSVLMTVVRLDEFVRPAIDSVLADLGSGDELVLVGDGCDIGPLQVAYSGRVRFVKLPVRQGTPSALNAGIEVARGKYIARLDADDICLPGRIGLQVAEFEARDDLVLLGGGAVIFDSGLGLEKVYLSPVGAETVKRMLVKRNSFVHSSVMIRSSALRAVGGYDPRMLRMQDYELFLRLASRGSIDNLDLPLVKYRVHGKMASHSNSPYAPYTGLVLRGRSVLSKHIGVPWVVSVSRNMAWWAAQVLRYHGLRRPRGRAS